MASLAEIRQQYPQYDDMPDADFAAAIHSKFYSDMPREQFDAKLGVAQPAAAAPEQAASGRNAVGRANAGFQSGAAQGLTFGLWDEISSGLMTPIEMAAGAIRGDDAGKGIGQRVSDAYGRNLDWNRGQDRQASQEAPIANVAGNLFGGGAVAGGAAKGGLSLLGKTAGASLPVRMGAGALEGAAYGGLYGAGMAEGGLGDRAAGAAQGATLGGLTGGFIPAAATAARGVTKPIADAVSARLNPSGYATRKVAERMGAGGMDMGQAANKMARAARGGQSMSLMDVGPEPVRDLARTANNIPGPARNSLTAQANISAMSQGDRIKRIVGTVLADPDGYAAAKDAVLNARATAAAPLYRQAYARPIPFTQHLEDLLDTPAGKRAMAEARVTAANSREPWAQWFANVDDAGNLIDRRRVPDMRALDEIKKSLDNMVEAAKRPADGPFGRAMNTPMSNSIKSVRNDLRNFLDLHNPVYRQARKVALTNIEADEALETGRRVLGMSGEQARRAVAGMTEGQKEMAQAGVAEAIRDAVDRAGDTHNALLRFFNTDQRRKALEAFFPSKTAFTQFRTAMFNEARKRRSFDALRGNSTTARQLLDAQDAGALAEGVQLAGQAATQGITATAISGVVRGLRRLGGLTPEVADNIGRMLQSRNPAAVTQIMRQLRQLEQSQLSTQAKALQARQIVTALLAQQESRPRIPAPPPMLATR